VAALSIVAHTQQAQGIYFYFWFDRDFYNATSSLARLESKNIFLDPCKTL
jgi:hypothetical protein